MNNITSITLVGGLLLMAGLGCANQKNSKPVTTTNQTMNAISSSTPASSPIQGPTFPIPSDSVSAAEITQDFDNAKSDLQPAIKKWRNKQVSFHGIVYTAEKGKGGKFEISLAGHKGMFTVFCDDIPASQANLVAKLKEDQTIIAINGVILGNGISGLVPGRVDNDVKAEKCKIVE